MRVHPDPHEELAAAIAAERAAWNRVKDKWPGTPDYDETSWAKWQALMQRCRDARRALDAAAAVMQSTAGRGRTPTD